MALGKDVVDDRTVFAWWPVKSVSTGKWMWWVKVRRIRLMVFTPMFDYLGREVQYYELQG